MLVDSHSRYRSTSAGVARGVERRDEVGVGLALARGQEAVQRFEVAPAIGRHRARERAEVQQVDVEVAGGGRDVAEPLELAPQPVAKTWLDHAGRHAQHRPRAPHGHAEVVQELRVGVVARCRPRWPASCRTTSTARLTVGVERALVGLEAQRQLRAVRAGPQPHGPQRLVDQVTRQRPQDHLRGQQLGDLGRGPLVAAHGQDLDDGREGGALDVGGTGVGDDLGPVDDDPGLGLVVAVDHAEHDPAAAHGDQLEQRPHLDDRGQPVGRGARREIPGEGRDLVDPQAADAPRPSRWPSRRARARAPAPPGGAAPALRPRRRARGRSRAAAAASRRCRRSCDPPPPTRSRTVGARATSPETS